MKKVRINKAKQSCLEININDKPSKKQEFIQMVQAVLLFGLLAVDMIMLIVLFGK